MATIKSAESEWLNRSWLREYLASTEYQNLKQQWSQDPCSDPWQRPRVSPDEDEVAKLRLAQARLQQELIQARQRLKALQAAYTALSQQRKTPLPADLDKTLKTLIALAHPDKWPGNQLAYEVTVALNKLREQIGKR